MVEAVNNSELVEQKKIAQNLTFGESDVGIKLFYSDVHGNG